MHLFYCMWFFSYLIRHFVVIVMKYLRVIDCDNIYCNRRANASASRQKSSSDNFLRSKALSFSSLNDVLVWLLRTIFGYNFLTMFYLLKKKQCLNFCNTHSNLKDFWLCLLIGKSIISWNFPPLNYPLSFPPTHWEIIFILFHTLKRLLLDKFSFYELVLKI